tara:strand:- start:456 stop:1532 length:1077 start_codon:yes stop_codon:yes gene_type:complete
MKKILIVTGGSGGHVVPSISLFEHLKNNFLVKIVTDQRGSKFINKKNYEYDLIDVPNLFTKLYMLPINIIKYLFNIFKSISFLKKNNIDILISTGGYMTLPFCLASYILRKKIFLFEPNSFLGRSNRIALKFSNKIICYDNDLKNFPTKYNSKKMLINPILKKQLYDFKINSTKEVNKLKKILIIGGSQGASFFDSNITQLILEISKYVKVEINQQVTKKKLIPLIKEKYDKLDLSYKIFDFTDNISDIYKEVDLAITRGGASTLSELSFLNIPFIAIPLPTARDNHQFHNSNYYLKKNLCWIINQKEFEINKTLKLIFELINNNDDYLQKINNLTKINQKNTWNNVNIRIKEILNEN